jgi:uncharacterized membrane protein YphA (DoxX/SURF4 family)
LEQYVILLVRVSIGLFFAISGANKLFVADGTKPVYGTCRFAGDPVTVLWLFEGCTSPELRARLK